MTTVVGVTTLSVMAACGGASGMGTQELSCDEAIAVLRGCADTADAAECSDDGPAARRIAAGDCDLGGDGKSDTWFDDGQQGDACWWDWQCSQAAGLVCRGTCAPPGTVGAACENDADCASGRCRATSDPAVSRRCADLIPTGLYGCVADRYCESGNCVEVEAGVYDATVCLDGEFGDACNRDDHCDSAACVDSLCRDRLAGSRCTRDAHCDSGTCFAGECR
ncbi:MAG: hypothetical protein JRI23_28015 [Deltaproteobacteria bacterium]|nr:hypothetical protein [Deltaproteobacteria bacterium]